MGSAASTSLHSIFDRHNTAARGSAPPVAIISPMPLDQLPDEELLQRHRTAIDGRERDHCINELFRRNYAKVARWCLRFAKDRESAADMAQEVCAKAYRNLDSFQGQSRFSTWLFVIARNHCLNAVRANAREATELKAEVEEDFFAGIPDASDTGPHAELERIASAQLVSEVLSQALDETEKMVFMLHYGEEVPLDTIGRMLQLENRSGAKAYIVSAKRKLARYLRRMQAREQSNG